MDLRKIKKLIDLLNESAIGEIEVKSGDESVRISKQSSVSAPAAPTVHIPASSAPTSPTPTSSDLKGLPIHSPMVGTAYLAKSPEAKPFVEIGQKVKTGDTICIIEAMKVFNPVKATFDGRIESCNIEDGHPVEFDETLFTIIPE